MKKFKLLFVFLFLGTIGVYAQSEISDSDGDTKIETERTADNDQIFFQTEGTDRWLMKSTRIEPYNSGNSIHIGVLAGENDDLTNNQNVFIGDQAGRNTTSGDGNVALGRQTLRVNTTGYGNMAIGALALNNNNGFFNVGIGSNALQFNTTGVKNMGIGQASLRDNTSGRDNVGIGANAFENNQTGNANLAMGSRAGFGITNGSQNVLLGFEAGDNAGLTSGNVMIGYQAGQNATGANQLYIDNSSTTSPLLYGEFDNDFLRINGDSYISGTNSGSPFLPALEVRQTGSATSAGMFYIGAGGGATGIPSAIYANAAGTGTHAGRFFSQSSDLAALFASSGSAASGPALEVNNNGSNQFTALFRGGDVDMDQSLNVDGDANVDGSFGVDTSGSQTFFVNAMTNRVGIGTTSPSQKLHIVGDDVLIDDSFPFYEANATSTSGNAGLLLSNDNFSTRGWMYLQGSTNDILISNSSSGVRDDIKIKPDGKVGVNMDAPEGQLHVQSNGLDFTDATIFAEETSTDASTRVAVRGKAISSTTDGRGYGAYFEGGLMGSRSEALGEGYTGTSYGSYGRATGTAGTRMGAYGIATGTGTGNRYGVYGFASGGDNAYAVFASGDAKVTSQLFIGTSVTDEANASSFELLVDGEAICEELKVELSGDWPDYVFESDYALPTLSEVKAHIDEHKHLPGVPSQATIAEEGGFFIGNMHQVQMKKIEELTLYAIDADEKIATLEKESSDKIATLEKENNELKSLLLELSNRIDQLEKK